jgi:hypothetical protein
MVIQRPRGPSLAHVQGSRCSRSSSTTSTPRCRSRRQAPEPDQELLQFNVRLAKRQQALRDTNRIERKAF